MYSSTSFQPTKCKLQPLLPYHVDGCSLHVQTLKYFKFHFRGLIILLVTFQTLEETTIILFSQNCSKVSSVALIILYTVFTMKILFFRKLF